MRKSCMLALLVLTAGASVSAAEKEPKETSQKATSKKDKVVCRSEKLTGSRTKVRRICMTLEQWDQLAANTRNSMDEASRTAGRGSTKSSSDPFGGI